MQFVVKGCCSPRNPSGLLEEDPGQKKRGEWPVIHCLFLFCPTLPPTCNTSYWSHTIVPERRWWPSSRLTLPRQYPILMRDEIVELGGFFSPVCSKKLVLDKQTSKIKLNMCLINEVQKNVWNKNLATTGTQSAVGSHALLLHIFCWKLYTFHNFEPPVCFLIFSIKLLHTRNMHKGNYSTHFMVCCCL